MCWREALECNGRVHFARLGLSIHWHIACIMLFIQCGSWLKKFHGASFPVSQNVLWCIRVEKRCTRCIGDGSRSSWLHFGNVAQTKSLWLFLYSLMLCVVLICSLHIIFIHFYDDATLSVHLWFYVCCNKWFWVANMCSLSCCSCWKPRTMAQHC